jgi:hypothetical protein
MFRRESNNAILSRVEEWRRGASSCFANQSLQSHAARDGCEPVEWREGGRGACVYS